MKKVISACVLIVMLLSDISVFAYSYPSSFWNVNSKYITAIESNNYADIIEYGNQIINLMKNCADGPEKRDILVTRYNQIGLAYAALGDYENSAKTFDTLYNYAKKYGDTYYDYVKSAKARKEQYAPSVSLYTDGGTAPFYNAINEKNNGVLFGICANGGTRSKLDHESLLLTYQEFGQNLLSYNTGIVREASQKGLAVEFALNCPNEGDDIRNINNKDKYLKEISDMLKKYSDVPIYLRFAAEFDIWDNQVDAESFKYAFRHVADYFHQRNPNVAMVWSPNCVSNWDVDIDDYYPGDSYVNWVGMSLYAQKYFLADPAQPDEYQVVFGTGRNSDPVVVAKNIIETYGNRKPIMISESGCGHRLLANGKTTEDTSAFGLKRLREYLNYLPMVYPQIKVMAYFDWYVTSGAEKNDFRLSTNTDMQNEYVYLTKGGRFIQDKYSNTTNFCYRKVENGTQVETVFPVSCYAHKYNADIKSVTYYLNGKYTASADQIPYTVYINASGYEGNAELKAVISFMDGTSITEISNIVIDSTASNITVKIAGDEVNFDQEPILYNDRTMVPLRKIFEELGATVTWNNNTQTAMAKRGDRTVKVTIGSTKMCINNKIVTLDTSPIIVSDRTLVPARAVAEGMGCDVDWVEKTKTVLIEPKVFEWSNWAEKLPDDVDDDLYYIEEKEEYRYRNRYEAEINMTFMGGNFSRREKVYGEWSGWSRNRIDEDENTEVETRTQYESQRYHFAHYCTGNISDKDNRYKTWDHFWHDECTYHDLGWFDEKLPYSEDSTSDYAYFVDGKKYRCSNTCYRWYLIETTGGDYTEYRSRKISYKYYYWQYTDWSDWDDDYPYNAYDFEERTLYRYKEK